jgi:CheY-like chemotaxis protein
MTRSSSSRRTVVIIDGSVVSVEVAKAALESAGYRVIARDRSPGSVNLILKEKPALVLLDVNMPQITGDRIAEIIAKSEPRPESIILLYSGLEPEILRAKAAASGAHGFIHKGGSAADLVRQVNQWLKAGSSPEIRALRPQDVPSSVPEPASDSGESSTRLRVALRSDDATARGRVDSDAALSAPPPSKNTGSHQMPVHVLFLSDEIEVDSRVDRELSQEQLVARFARSGTEALAQIASEQPPDVIVCDLAMPNVNGTELHRRAVASDATYGTRFVFLVPAAAAEYQTEFLRTVSGRVLYRPFELERLLSAIRYAAAQARSAGRIRQARRR